MPEPFPMDRSHATTLRPATVVWIGPQSNELGWLAECVANTQVCRREVIDACQILRVRDRSDANLQELAQIPIDRIIVALDNRWDFSPEVLQKLSQVWPEIPLAIATGDYWLGARRTGIGTTSHLIMPWFRWWDSWLPWLDGSNARLFGSGSLELPSHRAIRPKPLVQSGHVLGRCANAVEAWCTLAKEFTQSVTYSQTFNSSLENESFDWVLWDDTELDSCFGPNRAVQQATTQLQRLRQMQPRAIIIAALTLPNWSLWNTLLSAVPTIEDSKMPPIYLLAKPSHGQGLRRIVYSSCLPAAFSSAALART